MWMFSKVLTVLDDAKEPDFSKWADCVRLIRERDGKTDSQIRELFEWANRDPFWRANVRSPDKLRAKWDDLKAKMNTNIRAVDKDQDTLKKLTPA